MLEALLSSPPLIKAAPGQVQYVIAGTYSWKVPDGVKSICAVCIGGGSQASSTGGFFGGMGAALRWENNIPVTPGETLTIVVAAGKPSIGYTGALGYSAGNDTIIKRGSTILLKAAGGRQTSDQQIADSVGVNGGNGGVRISAPNNNSGIPGSGTGGYFGDGGGSSANAQPTDTTAGKAGGTSGNSVNGQYISGGGDGTGAFLTGQGGSGTRCGAGGGCTSRSSDYAKAYGPGGTGGCRIIWGTDRSYPSNALDVAA